MCSHELSRETRVMLRKGRDSISFHNFAVFVGFQLSQYEIYLIPHGFFSI